MKELKKLQLNNKSLDDFDTLMNYHLDKIEELEIDEININAKLYNLISLCTNLKQLSIKGDLRSDVNQIFFNICNPESIETLILESVKLPTNKAFSSFTNLSTISLNNINFSDLVGFLNKIPNPEKIVALNLTNVDFGKRAISVCGQFKNLKYLNLDNLKNCAFDSFEFIYDHRKMARFEFYHNELGFENVFVVPEQELPDGEFPTVSYPNPEAAEAFELALKLAKEHPYLYRTVGSDAHRIGDEGRGAILCKKRITDSYEMKEVITSGDYELWCPGNELILQECEAMKRV